MRGVLVAPLLFGLSIFGVGEGLLVQSQWGATPWTVFAEGISRHSLLSLGWATALISAVVLLLWIPLRERPGIGTLSNLIVIALFLQLTVDYLPVAHQWWLKLLYIVGAIEIIGVGSTLYLTTGLGPGPRDGLMTSLHRRLGVSVVYVRIAIEVSVLSIGWLLGGTVGVGTALFAGLIGYSIGFNLQLLRRLIER
jgi:uncharacterized protein